MLQQIAAAMAAVLLTASPAAPLSQNAVDFTAFLNETNQAHAQIDAPRADLSTYRYNFDGGKPLFTTEDGALLKVYDGNAPAANAVITPKDARSEVQWLFRLLRTQYGLYQWSGGDSAFEAAQTRILSALPKSGTMSVSAYQKLLVGELSFIRDAHFMIGQSNMWNLQQLYSDESRPFYKKGDSFFSDAGCTRRVQSINGGAPGDFIHRAIGPSGQLTWYLYITAPAGESVNVVLSYGDKTETLSLRPAISFEGSKASGNRFRFSEQNGIPFVEINEMFFGDGDSSGWTNINDEPLKQNVLKTADDLKKYPAAVLDLSHNPGGNGQLPLEWFKRYTGQTAQPNYCTLRIRPGESWLRSGYGAQTAADVTAIRTQQDSMWLSFGLTPEGTYYTEIPQKQFLDTDGPLLFVLTSRATNSAAEGFTDTLHNLKNTVTIGSNTGGVLTNAANYALKLPYSNLPLQFGECLFLWDKDYFEEGRGMAPDLYLTGDNLDGRLTMFLQRYASGMSL